MKKSIVLCICAVLAMSCGSRTAVQPPVVSEPAPYAVYAEGLIGSVKPQGWLKEYLERQRTGLSGHPDAMCYPYNTCLWAGDIARERGKHGSDWWRYEQTAYYSDGLIRLGYLLDDEQMYGRVEDGIHYSLAKVDSLGIFGSRWHVEDGDDRYHVWPQAVFFRAIQAYYEAKGDETILPALERHFLGMPVSMLGSSRNAINIEGALWTYAHTGNEALLQHAVDAWNHGDFWLHDPERLTEPVLVQHGVTACEQLKLPVILYAYTGDRSYLDLALALQKRIEDEDMLPDGVPSSAEYFSGKTANHSHETCDIADYSWTLGYFLMATGEARWGDGIERAVFNAGPGACGKDFRTIQYFSSVNQFNCTGHSNNNEFMHGRTWMEYRPVHQTECCVGNVHRIMPNYVARMWMTAGKDELVSALYGPSEVSIALSDGSVCTVTEDTAYPFEDDIRFRFAFDRRGRHDMSLSLRIPQWASSFTLSLNGRNVPYTLTEGGFARVEGSFRSGDELGISFEIPIEVKDLDGQGDYVTRGPVLYTFAIPEECTEDTETYPYIHGKESADPEFKSWNKTPAADWNYALKGVKASDLTLERTGSGAYPFDEPACRISVPVVQIRDWVLDEGVFTPENPAVAVPVDGAEVKHIDLVPYGGTYLRLTVFPVVE